MTANDNPAEYRDKTFSDVYHEKLESSGTCAGDVCDVSYELRRRVNEMDDPAKDKLRRWLGRMGPMDYDAPGSRARESGV